MKKIVQVISSLLIVTMFTSLQSQAQLKLIHYWNFDNTLPCGGAGGVQESPLSADYSTIGNAVLVYDNSQTSAASCGCPVRDSILDNDISTDTLNLRTGYTTNTCSGDNSEVRTRNPSTNMNFLWYMPTTGYQNILLIYDTQSSGSGQKYQVMDYSLDSGMTWTNAGLAPTTTPSDAIDGDTVLMTNFNATAYAKIVVDLSSISGINNNPKFVFRIHFGHVVVNGMTTSQDTTANGNNRFDNITLEGDSLVTGINEITANHGYSVYPNPANDLLNITSANDGDKVISIFNVVGQLVSSFITSERQIPLNISQFSSGIYCLNIRETNGGNSYTVKFVKN